MTETTTGPRAVLVTGAGGFLGWHTGNYLARRGCRVAGIDVRFPDPAAAGRPEFIPLRHDFRDWDRTREALAGMEAVVHLASAHLQVSLDEQEYWDVNVHALRTLLEEAHQAGVRRFLHISSVGIYGRLRQIPANEDTPCHPQSIYGETKLAGEQVVREACAALGMEFLILRPTWVYGQGCPRTAKLARMLGKRRFFMIGRGGNKRHPLYIEDMLESFRLALEAGDKALGQTMIVGGPEIVTTRELVDAFSRVLDLPGPLFTLPYPLGRFMAAACEGVFGLAGKEPPISRRTLEFFDTDNGFDISRARDLLGFAPRYDLEQGLAHYRETLKPTRR